MDLSFVIFGRNAQDAKITNGTSNKDVNEKKTRRRRNKGTANTNTI